MPIPTRILTLQQLLDRLVERIRRLETRRTTSIGNWILEERASDGALVARNMSDGREVVLAS